jgi:hypothetical protein
MTFIEVTATPYEDSGREYPPENLRINKARITAIIGDHLVVDIKRGEIIRGDVKYKDFKIVGTPNWDEL